MALCRGCDKVIPCHCHVTPPAEIRPGVYLTTETRQKIRTKQRVDATRPGEAR